METRTEGVGAAVAWRGAGIASYRYGPQVLWSVAGDLAGSQAARFAGRVGLFFRSGGFSLLLDVRRTGFVDSAGVRALAVLRESWPALRVVGLPASWRDFPLAVRTGLLGLSPVPDLESALAAREQAADVPDRRRHPRVPLQLPVELFLAGERVPAALRDVSRGGVSVSGVRPAGALRDGTDFDLIGLAEDPLCRELLGAVPDLVRLTCVRAADAAGLGARFAGSPPPV